MTSRRAMRLTMTLGVMLLAGTAAASQAPAAAEAKPEASAATAEPEPIATSKTQPEQAVVILNRKDKISYALGVDLAKDLQRQSNDINLDLVLRALTDALAGRPLVMTDADVAATLKRLEEERKHDYEHAKAMIGERNRREAEAFFSDNAKKEGVVTLPSGLQYKVLKQGDGQQPTIADHVICHYRGTLVDGTEFDSSYKRKQPATLPVKAVIAGWTQALQLMPVGSKWQVFVPPQLAYGDKIVAGIGPNAMLIFEVELLSIQDKAQTASTAK